MKYNPDYYQTKKEDIKKQQREYYNRNKEKIKYKHNQYTKKLQDNAWQSLVLGIIIDIKLWDIWFTQKQTNKNDATYDLTSYEAFELMAKKCFYCNDIATTLDRLNSNLTHTTENSVGCCDFCNRSKGAKDPLTFILQVVYRRRFIYYEDEDIWNDNTYKATISGYKRKAQRQKTKFDLSQLEFDALIKGNCHYCKRFPQKSKFIGIDRLFPDDGYVINNCVSACASCNHAKWDASLEEFTLRDERITQRYLSGQFEDMPYITKNISYLK